MKRRGRGGSAELTVEGSWSLEGSLISSGRLGIVVAKEKSR